MDVTDVARLRAAWQDHPAIVGLCNELLKAWEKVDQWAMDAEATARANNDMIVGLIAERDTALARVAELETENQRLRRIDAEVFENTREMVRMEQRRAARNRR